ncbi:hypothetical protein BT93_A1908 [Corymbia citriodora subsp. variegata]|nr:hypothetical protein BT93_A1908 [Corymbia citriodora subsp. variegata]
MGNVLAGTGEKSTKEFEQIIDRCYEGFRGSHDGQMSQADFFRLVCITVEEINKKLGNTQFRVPSVSTLEKAYVSHHQGKGKSLTKEEFQTILHEVIKGTGITGFGAKDIFFYLFGVPVAALFVKQRVAPNVIPNDIFIPGITSATVFILAKINKI